MTQTRTTIHCEVQEKRTSDVLDSWKVEQRLLTGGVTEVRRGSDRRRHR